MAKGKGKLESFVAGMKLGKPASYRNLTIIPIHGKAGCSIDYLLSDEAIASTSFKIEETSDHGSVPELSAVNQTDKRILLLDGEELRGAKQNRILNTSVLLDRQSRTKIPVSCVEQGRWSHSSRTFNTGGFANSSLRARKSFDVTQSYTSLGRAASDQRAVWNEVDRTICDSQSRSRTRAMSDVTTQKCDTIKDYINALARDEQASGVIVAIDGKFAAMDCFASPQTLAKVWRRLLGGYIIDAICSRMRKTDREKPFSRQSAGRVLARIKDTKCSRFSSAGVGEDWRFDGKDIVGQALVADNSCLHLCAFAKTQSDFRAKPRVKSKTRLDLATANDVTQLNSFTDEQMRRIHQTSCEDNYLDPIDPTPEDEAKNEPS